MVKKTDEKKLEKFVFILDNIRISNDNGLELEKFIDMKIHSLCIDKIEDISDENENPSFLKILKTDLSEDILYELKKRRKWLFFIQVRKQKDNLFDLYIECEDINKNINSVPSSKLKIKIREIIDRAKNMIEEEEIEYLLKYPKLEEKYSGELTYISSFGFFVQWENKEAEKYYNSLSLRLKKIFRCVEKIFKVWPPDKLLSSINDEDEKKILDVYIYLDSFILNTYAVHDNIANIWNGEFCESKFGRYKIGLIENKNNKKFIESLPEKFKKKLSRINSHLRNSKDITRNTWVHRECPEIGHQTIVTEELKKKYPELKENEKFLKDMLKEERFIYSRDTIKMIEDKCSKESLKRLRKEHYKNFLIKPILDLSRGHKINRWINHCGYKYIHSFLLDNSSIIIGMTMSFLTEIAPIIKTSKKVDRTSLLQLPKKLGL